MGKSSAHSSKRRSGGQMGYLLSFLLGSLLTFLGYSYLIREKPLSSEEFYQKVVLSNQIIQSQLYEAGIHKKDILSHRSSEKKEGGIAWKQSIFKIQLPRSYLPTIEENFRRSFSNLGKDFSLNSSQGSNSLQLEVKVMDQTIHQITFFFDKPLLKAGLRPKIAIVIDDLGGERDISQEFLHWDLPITFSILPLTPILKPLPQRPTNKGKKSFFTFPWSLTVILKSNLGKGYSFRRWMKRSCFANYREILRRFLTSKG